MVSPVLHLLNHIDVLRVKLRYPFYCMKHAFVLVLDVVSLGLILAVNKRTLLLVELPDSGIDVLLAEPAHFLSGLQGLVEIA